MSWIKHVGAARRDKNNGWQCSSKYNKECAKFINIQIKFDRKFDILELKSNILSDKLSSFDKALGMNGNVIYRIDKRIDNIEKKKQIKFVI